MHPDRFTSSPRRPSPPRSGSRSRASNSQVEPHHLLAALLEQEAASWPPCWSAPGPRCPPCARRTNAALDALATVTGDAYRRALARPRRPSSCSSAPRTRRASSATSTSPPSTCCWRWPRDPEGRRGRHAATSSSSAVAQVRGPHRVTDQNPEDSTRRSERFGRDLTEAAEQGKLDPVIGRDDEIRRVIQVLSRRTKNNPVLIGEPGVGKTAIAEGLAQRDRVGRRARLAARPARDRPGHRRADRRRQVPRRVRGPAQGRAQGDLGRPTAR